MKSQLTPPTRQRPSSLRKREAVLDAAEDVFLGSGFAAAGVDDVADRSGVSKQTVYAYFGNKEQLFVAVVGRMTGRASDAVHLDVPDPSDVDTVPGYLRDYATRQLDVVLDLRLLALRRLVIAEATRFPDLARTFWESGPHRAVAAMSERFARLTALGLLDAPDADAAAQSFNWLLMGAPLNAAMMLGDAAVPGPTARRHLAAETTRVFLAAYGVRR